MQDATNLWTNEVIRLSRRPSRRPIMLPYVAQSTRTATTVQSGNNHHQTMHLKRCKRLSFSRATRPWLVACGRVGHRLELQLRDGIQMHARPAQPRVEFHRSRRQTAMTTAADKTTTQCAIHRADPWPLFAQSNPTRDDPVEFFLLRRENC